MLHTLTVIVIHINTACCLIVSSQGSVMAGSKERFISSITEVSAFEGVEKSVVIGNRSHAEGS